MYFPDIDDEIKVTNNRRDRLRARQFRIRLYESAMQSEEEWS